MAPPCLAVGVKLQLSILHLNGLGLPTHVGLDGIVSLTFHEAFTGEFVERDSDVRVHKAGEFVGVPSNTGLKRRGGNKRMNMSYMNMVEAMSDPACVHI
ncbi:hypothetical protein JHK82_042234 [Glycine max]|nr:hypothetical protein JHK86_042281 [Glycine max]KAG4956520.1 hypothetical protein JHK85_042900 [Glycine max]KAG5105264.1 hypothetical protein JHK82_042234 [Glycine max]